MSLVDNHKKPLSRDIPDWVLIRVFRVIRGKKSVHQSHGFTRIEKAAIRLPAFTTPDDPRQVMRHAPLLGVRVFSCFSWTVDALIFRILDGKAVLELWNAEHRCGSSMTNYSFT
ncbi:hypothetical protein [Sulfidibacter corallicola]|uniref:Uncharacterized protein n=1 Tax=Sulfidibacter corallicola TaxID=2818388 RepID=A0A8A4TIZ1_SULCO|nr:hypothetical protein [Sulfidibacter corallicola]QTD49520.1 hypothetical protein J3U87_28370 [Sulfidibacter corallicola]